MTVSIKVLYFASARDAANNIETETIQIEDTDTTTLPTLSVAIDILKSKHPGLERVLETAMISINEEYCDIDEAGSMNKITLKSNDVVAIIPPVSGG